MKKRLASTDMAVEFIKSKHRSDDGVVRYYDVSVDKKLSDKIGKPCGRYSTLETSAVISGRREEYGRVSKALSDCISEYCNGCRSEEHTSELQSPA